MAVNMVVSAADEVAANPPTTITANTQSSALITNKAMKQRKPLQIAEQGIFSVGGVVLQSEGTFNPEDLWEATGAGQTLHADHANVMYQIPVKADEAPMIFLHGYGQSRMGWMTTPNGRPGWSDYFLREGHSVFLVDQPRRGEAGTTSVPGIITNKHWINAGTHNSVLVAGKTINPSCMKVPNSRMMMLRLINSSDK